MADLVQVLGVVFHWWWSVFLPSAAPFVGAFNVIAPLLGTVAGWAIAAERRRHALPALRKVVVRWASKNGVTLGFDRTSATMTGRGFTTQVALVAKEARAPGWVTRITVTGPAVPPSLTFGKPAGLCKTGDPAFDQGAGVWAPWRVLWYGRLTPALRPRLLAFVRGGGQCANGTIRLERSDLRSLADLETFVRAALELAEALAVEPTMEDVIQRLDDPEPGIRLGAARALLEVAEADFELPDSVWRVLLEADNEPIRLRAALVQGDLATLRTLLPAAREVRVAAAKALAAAAPPGTADPEVEAALITGLALDDPGVPEALARIGSVTAVEALRRHDGVLGRGRAARRAIEVIERRASVKRGLVSLADLEAGGLSTADDGAPGRVSLERHPPPVPDR
jgi:hypothetical protein